MAAIEDAVYLMTLDHDLYLPPTILFSPPNEGQKKKKKQAKWVLKEDVDLNAWAGNFWENQINKAEG